MSDRTQDLKNLRAVATACKNYTDKKIEDLRWELGTYDLSVETINGTTMLLPSPSGTIQSTMVRIDGASSKYNQIANITSGSGTDNASVNTYNIDLSNISNSCVVGHKYLFAFNLTVSDNTKLTNYRVRYPFVSVTDSILSGKNRYYVFGTAEETTSPRIQIIKPSTSATSETYSYDITNVIDLTAIFGSGNEPNDVATAKTSLLALGINVDTNNPYSLGEIHNLELSGLKVEGANLCNPSELLSNQYTISNDGSYLSDNTRGCIDYIEVKSSNYFASFSTSIAFISVAFYDKAKNYVSRLIANDITSFSISIPSDIKYFRMSFQYNTQVQMTSALINDTLKPMLNYGSSALTYAPYIAPTTKTIDLSTILYNGSPLFEGNSLKAVNDVKDILTPYKATKKLGYVDLGTLDYTYVTDGAYPIFVSSALSDIKVISSGTPNFLSNSKYTLISTRSETAFKNSDFNGQYTIRAAQKDIMFRDTNYTSESAFKTAMSGIYLIYELATPLVSNTNLSQLVKFEAHSNGSITLGNTNNQDTTSTFKYLKEVAK